MFLRTARQISLTVRATGSTNPQTWRSLGSVLPLHTSSSDSNVPPPIDDQPKHFAHGRFGVPVDQGAKSKDDEDYVLRHPVWSEEHVQSVGPTHRKPRGISDRIAFSLVKALRWSFDKLTGYSGGEMTEKQWVNRFIFLETIAGVPGMVGGMTRHLLSLGLMRRDHGWIHTLLEEAENERMHLLTFLQLKQPGPLFRAGVIGAQAVFWPVFFTGYLLFPKTCHRFVGYLEEEAVHTYSRALSDYDRGIMPQMKETPAPEIAVKYWQLKDGSTMRDVLLAVRADEAEHRDVNHTFSSMDRHSKNPFK